MSLALARQRGNEFAAALRSDPPIDVEAVARRHGVRVLKDHLGLEISGVLMTTPGNTPTIVVHSAHAPTRRRFTIAHELGHFVLGHQRVAGDHVIVDRGNFISLRGPRAATGVDYKEIEANQFAACLLMPEGLLRKHAATLGPEHRLDDTDVIKLAKQFQVSEQAMTIRLSTLGLL